MSVEDVIASVNPQDFNPIGLRECFRDVALRGCAMGEDSDRIGSERRDGIPYARSFEFSKQDRLVGISLKFDREESVTQGECFDIFGRTLDWATKEYGSFGARTYNGKSDINQHRTTPGGLGYRTGVSSDGNENSEMLFAPPPTDKDRSATSHTRYASLFGIYLGGSLHKCMVTLDLREPDTVVGRVMTAEEYREADATLAKARALPAAKKR